MEWIASMPGPQFLGLYAAVIAATLIGCWFAMRNLSGDGPEPMVPLELDPYQLAWLRGGDDEVGRLAVIDLARRGLLQAGDGAEAMGAARLRRTEAPLPSGLQPGALQALQVFETLDLPLPQIQRHPAFLEAVRAIADPIAARFGDQFLVSSSQRLSVLAGGLLVVWGLGGYKLAVALSKGRTNVGFLCLLAFLAAIALWMITRARLNGRGRDYLDRARGANRDLRARPGADASPLSPQELLLTVALFGAPVLLGGPDMLYASMLGHDMLLRSSGEPNYSSSGSSASGDSCSSGGGDGGGGGCGGCGGGE